MKLFASAELLQFGHSSVTNGYTDGRTDKQQNLSNMVQLGTEP